MGFGVLVYNGYMDKKNAGYSEDLVQVRNIADGIVTLKNGELRRIILVDGINFDLKSEEEQQIAIWGFQNLVNSLDFSIQISIHSRKFNIEDYLNHMEVRRSEEDNETLRSQIAEYIEFIKSFVKVNAVMSKSFFVVVPYNPVNLPKTGTVQNTQDNIEQLKQRADQVISGLRRMGLRGLALDDSELIELYYNLYNSRTVERAFEDSHPRGNIENLGLENVLAPESIEISPNYLKIGDKFAKTLYALDYPRYLSTGWFSPIINLANLIDVSIFIHPTDTAEVLKKLQNKTAQIESQIIDAEEKGLVRNPMLETAFNDVESLRDTLQQGQERLFRVGIYMVIYADTLPELKKFEGDIKHLMASKLIYLAPPTFEQLNGFTSVVPLGLDKLNINVPMNSSPLSSLFPFVSLDLTSDKGILYGINRHNNTLIIFDRFSMENANMVVFAKSGSGKSYATKIEIIRSLMMGTDVVVVDPENEYLALAEAMGGSIIKISVDSENHINPFDIPSVPEGENPGEVLKSHIINLSGLLKLMLGTINPTEEALLDQALTETYASRDITADRDFTGSPPPLLEDFRTILEGLEGGKEMSSRLYRFTEGSFAGFLNQPTNINIKNRLIVFSIRELEEGLRPIAMFIILNFIWNLIRAELKKRIMIIDEAWWMMKYPDSAVFLYGLVKRARKYYLGISTITQDVEDFLNSPYGRPIITNSSIQLLLKQAPATIDMATKSFNLTDVEKNYLLETGVGQGLFVAGLKRAAIQIVASGFEHGLVTTNPEELLRNKQDGTR